MVGLTFSESLIVEVENPVTYQQVEDTLASVLFEKGYVKDSYARAISVRERDYPTALEVGDVNVAIPHCDVEHVNAGAICVGLLRHPVCWRRMDDPDCTCKVSLVFMLALNEAHAHLEMLQKIAAIIQDQALAAKLVESSPKQAYDLLKDWLA